MTLGAGINLATKLIFEFAFPDGSLKTCEVPKGGVVWLGRHEECDIVLPSLAVSRRHASFAWEPTGVLVTDHSQNGTAIDGTLLKRSSQRLSANSCKIAINPYSFRLVVRAPIRDDQPDVSKNDSTERASAASRRRIHRALLDHLELPKLSREELENPAMRARVSAALQRIIESLADELPERIDQEQLVSELSDEILGLGPLESLLADDDVNEIMVVDPQSIYVERKGKLERTSLRFTDNESVRAIIERIITPLGRRIDESNPLVDARLKDGSRVNAIIPPLAVKGACLTIRKFTSARISMSDLVRAGSLDQSMATFLEHAVSVHRNIVVSGGTGSGKTTLLNILSAAIGPSERIVTIEDAAELKLAQPHVVSLEARPANLEGKGEFTIRALVKNALRMRPDRIIVGECRGDEVLDMLQAMNTGHEGSMTSTHANSPREAISRIETLCLMAGVDLPLSAIRAQIASSIHLIVQQARFSDGSRRITSITEITGMNERGEVRLSEIFDFRPASIAADGVMAGEFRATGQLPSFLDRFMNEGLIAEDAFL